MDIIKLMNFLHEEEINFTIKELKYSRFCNMMIDIEYGTLEVVLNQEGKFDLYFDDYEKMFDLGIGNTIENIKSYIIG